jgi:hypothetical protein
MMTIYDLFETADFDPWHLDMADSLGNSFLYMDERFVPVPYQSHLMILSNLFGIGLPSQRDFKARMLVCDQLNALASQHSIVQGTFSPPRRNCKCTMGLVGPGASVRTAYAAFRRRWPDLLAQLDSISYDIQNQDGIRIESDYIEGSKIDRKFGKRF